jgi:hypothetical protein
MFTAALSAVRPRSSGTYLSKVAAWYVANAQMRSKMRWLGVDRRPDSDSDRQCDDRTATESVVTNGNR